VRKGTPRLPATWREYRHDNGDFKQWLHTWTFINDKPSAFKEYATRLVGGTATLFITQHIPPLPWVWDEQPHEGFLDSLKIIGALKHAPGGWGRVNLYEMTPLYGVLLPVYGPQGFQAWAERERRDTASISHWKLKCDEKFLLINNPGEKTTCES